MGKIKENAFVKKVGFNRIVLVFVLLLGQIPPPAFSYRSISSPGLHHLPFGSAPSTAPIVLVFVLLMMYLAFGVLTGGKFFGTSRIINTLNYVYFLGFLSLGVTSLPYRENHLCPFRYSLYILRKIVISIVHIILFVFLCVNIATGGIDFSIGPVMFCCALVSGYSLTTYGVPMAASLAMSVLTMAQTIATLRKMIRPIGIPFMLTKFLYQPPSAACGQLTDCVFVNTAAIPFAIFILGVTYFVLEAMRRR